MLHLLYCTKVSTDHDDCGNLSALAERTQIGLLGDPDTPTDLELLGGVVGLHSTRVNHRFF